ncbi:hypothetical protein Tco_0246808 [Tanacetum coccineum]
MMYERQPTTLFNYPPRNTNFPFQNYTLVIQQHQDESIYDAWNRFQKLNPKSPSSWPQFIWKTPTSTISDQTIANLKAQLVENEVVRVMIPKCMSWLDAYDEPIEVDETTGILMEVEPLDHTKLEDLGLNTYNHDIPLTSRGIPSVDELEPQLLPNFSPLDEITNGNLHAGILEENKKFLLYRPWRRRQGVARLYLMRRSLKVLRKFLWMLLEGRFNQLSHVSSPLLSKPGEY